MQFRISRYAIHKFSANPHSESIHCAGEVNPLSAAIDASCGRQYLWLLSVQIVSPSSNSKESPRGFDKNLLRDSRPQMHLDAPGAFIETRHVLELRQHETSAQFPVDPRQQV